MIYNKTYKMEWIRKQHKIENGRIVPIEKGEGVKYNPFDYYGEGKDKLYLKFITIDETKPKQIENFINEFGTLGLDRDMNRIDHIYIKFLETKNKLYKEVIKPFKERDKEKINNLTSICKVFEGILIELSQGISDIDDFIREVKTMRIIVGLWEALKNSNNKKMIYLINEYWEDKNPEIAYLEMDCFNYEIEIRNHAKLHIVTIIDKYLKNVTPTIDFIETSQKFISGWAAVNLITAMYTMLYMDIVKEKKIRKCGNETCSDYFFIKGNDERMIYCDHSCARQQTQREYRRRAKVKALFKEGKSPENISKITGIELEKINKWIKVIKEGV